MDSSFEQYLPVLTTNTLSPVVGQSRSNLKPPPSLPQNAYAYAYAYAYADPDPLFANPTTLTTSPTEDENDSLNKSTSLLAQPLTPRTNATQPCPTCEIAATSEQLQNELIADLRSRLQTAEEAHRRDLDLLASSHEALVKQLREANKTQAQKLKEIQARVLKLTAEKQQLRSRLDAKEDALSLLTRHAMTPAQPHRLSGDRTHDDDMVAPAPAPVRVTNLLMPDPRKPLRLSQTFGKLDLKRGRGERRGKAEEFGNEAVTAVSSFADVLLKPPGEGQRQSSFQVLQALKLKAPQAEASVTVTNCIQSNVRQRGDLGLIGSKEKQKENVN